MITDYRVVTSLKYKCQVLWKDLTGNQHWAELGLGGAQRNLLTEVFVLRPKSLCLLGMKHPKSQHSE